MAQTRTTTIKTGNNLEVPLQDNDSDKVSVISAYREDETYNQV